MCIRMYFKLTELTVTSRNYLNAVPTSATGKDIDVQLTVANENTSEQ
jgi:hypothetical protein